MGLSDIELINAYAQDDSLQGIGFRQRAIESWISAGLLTPQETKEARRVLRLLRKRSRAGTGLS